MIEQRNQDLDRLLACANMARLVINAMRKPQRVLLLNQTFTAKPGVREETSLASVICTLFSLYGPGCLAQRNLSVETLETVGKKLGEQIKRYSQDERKFESHYIAYHRHHKGMRDRAWPDFKKLMVSVLGFGKSPFETGEAEPVGTVSVRLGSVFDEMVTQIYRNERVLTPPKGLIAQYRPTLRLMDEYVIQIGCLTVALKVKERRMVYQIAAEENAVCKAYEHPFFQKLLYVMSQAVWENETGGSAQYLVGSDMEGVEVCNKFGKGLNRPELMN